MYCISFLIKQTLPALLLEKATRKIVQIVLESSKYCSQGKHGMLCKSSCLAPKEVQPPLQQCKKSSCLLLSSLNPEDQFLTVGRWQGRNGAIYLLNSCRTWGRNKGRKSPSSCSAPTPLWLMQGLQLGPALAWLESAGRTCLPFSGAVPRGCRGVTQCHRAAHS